MPQPQYPKKPVPGDKVAVVSPSAGLPGILPMPFELGLQRLTDDFKLVPVEYPATRKMGSSPAERAADLHAAFSDPTIKAVIASIGGDDQITVLPHLDPELLRVNPKPFFGFSDCTNLLAYLSQLGIVGYHGGAVMTAFGRPGRMHPLTAESLHAALFGREEYRLRPSEDFGDVNRDWAEPQTFDAEPAMLPGQGWQWTRPDKVVTGRSWGGCLEVVSWLLMADVAVPPLTEFDGGVLFLETTEEMPSAVEVYRMLRGIGERGILGRCGAVVMGRPKGWSFANPNTDAQRDEYVAAQHEAVLRAADQYAPEATVVLDVDFGHTDPQLIIPYGGIVHVDGPNRAITVRY